MCKQYISNYRVTPEEAIEAVLTVARGELGYPEKASDNNLDSKKGIAGKRLLYLRRRGSERSEDKLRSRAARIHIACPQRAQLPAKPMAAVV